LVSRLDVASKKGAPPFRWSPALALALAGKLFSTTFKMLLATKRWQLSPQVHSQLSECR
jgi:hypothetical protein